MKEEILKRAEANQKRAREVVSDLDIVNIWGSVGAEANLVGSLRTGLLMSHFDIDFHIYSSPLLLKDSYAAMAKLAENLSVKRIESVNLLDTEEECVEWHAWCEDRQGDIWQIDMIHIRRGSFYDGYMERVADGISRILTPESKYDILKLKSDTPESVKIPGIYYYKAVLGEGIRDYASFSEWFKTQPEGVLQWMP